MIKSILITLLFAAVIAATSRYLLTIEANYTKQLVNEPTQQHYSHQFKNFSLTNTNAEGVAQSVIHSPQTRLFVEQHKTLMDSPKMVMYRQQEPPITITADNAEVLHLQNVTVLQDNVNVSMPNQHKQIIHMETEQLTLDNISQNAKTHLAATITHNNGIMRGTGLEFNPNTKQIKFLTNVRGTYEY